MDLWCRKTQVLLVHVLRSRTAEYCEASEKSNHAQAPAQHRCPAPLSRSVLPGVCWPQTSAWPHPTPRARAEHVSALPQACCSQETGSCLHSPCSAASPLPSGPSCCRPLARLCQGPRCRPPHGPAPRGPSTRRARWFFPPTDAFMQW